MTTALSRLQRITSVVADSGAAADYLATVFGAPTLDGRQLDGQQERPGTRLVGMGDAVIELVTPQSDDYWSRRLAEVGPGIVSLAYAVQDRASVAADLGARGLPCVAETGSRVIVETTSQLGFDLELLEGDPDVGPSAPSLWGRVSPMMQVEITYESNTGAREVLRELFAVEDVEAAFSSYLTTLTGGRMTIRHVALGDAMLQLIEPRDTAGPWWDQLQERGASVHNLTWFVEDMPAVEAAARAAGTPDLRYFEFDYSALFGIETMTTATPVGRILDTRSLLGFHVELSEPMTSRLNDFMFKQSPSPHFG